MPSPSGSQTPSAWATRWRAQRPRRPRGSSRCTTRPATAPSRSTVAWTTARRWQAPSRPTPRCWAQQHDTAYALAAYLRWGAACPEYLLGDFAFAIWDGRQRRLLLARDPLGIRALYYSLWGGRFTFASTLEQLLTDRDLPRELNEEALARFIYGGASALGTQTTYQHIQSLPGGHLLLVAAQAARLRRYWRWPERPPEPPYPRRAALRAEFRALFAEAVRCRLRRPAPVGLLLSGGLDSGAVAAMAGHLHASEGIPPLRAYSNVFDRFASCDERRYSTAVTVRYDLPHTCLAADDAWSFAHFDQWLPVYNEPFVGLYDSALYPLLARARADGCRVMLMGHGGDHLLAGSLSYLADWLVRGRWRALRAQLQARGGGSHLLYLAHFAASALYPLLPVEPQQAIGQSPDSAPVRALAPLLPPHLRHPLALRTVVDAASWRPPALRQRLFGLEVRQPFLDVRLVEFCLRAPPAALYRDGTPKALLRESLRDLLPPLIHDRPDKGDLSPLLRHSVGGPRHAFVAALLDDSELARRGLVLPEPWLRHLRAYVEQNGPPYWAYWRGHQVEMWLRHQGGRLPPFARHEA